MACWVISVWIFKIKVFDSISFPLKKHQFMLLSVTQLCCQELCALTRSQLPNDTRCPLSKEYANVGERARICLHGFRIWLIVVASLLTSIFKFLQLFISLEILDTLNCHHLKIETFCLSYFTREVLMCARHWVQRSEIQPWFTGQEVKDSTPESNHHFSRSVFSANSTPCQAYVV